MKEKVNICPGCRKQPATFVSVPLLDSAGREYDHEWECERCGYRSANLIRLDEEIGEASA